MTRQDQLAIAPEALPIRVVGTTINGRGLAGATGVGAGGGIARWAGLVANEYRIPWRNSRLEPLTLDVIAGYISDFLAFARERPEQQFIVMPFAGHLGTALAKMFVDVPPNCALPGAWLRTSNAAFPARLFLLDPELRLREKGGQIALQKLIAELRISGTQKFELVTLRDHTGEKIYALTAKLLGATHVPIERVAVSDSARSAVLTEAHAIWYATHLVLISARASGTTHSAPIRLLGLAAREGLDIIDISGSTATQ